MAHRKEKWHKQIFFTQFLFTPGGNFGTNCYKRYAHLGEASTKKTGIFLLLVKRGRGSLGQSKKSLSDNTQIFFLSRDGGS